MNALPHSPYRRALVEAQEEALDDRSDRVKLEDACRLRIVTKAKRDALINDDAFRRHMAAKADDRAFTRIVEILNEQFGDEVDVELLAKALVS
jgi:hypothetical protein